MRAWVQSKKNKNSDPESDHGLNLAYKQRRCQSTDNKAMPKTLKDCFPASKKSEDKQSQKGHKTVKKKEKKVQKKEKEVEKKQKKVKQKEKTVKTKPQAGVETKTVKEKVVEEKVVKEKGYHVG